MSFVDPITLENKAYYYYYYVFRKVTNPNVTYSPDNKV